jgi:hypothetical protein
MKKMMAAAPKTVGIARLFSDKPVKNIVITQ